MHQTFAFTALPFVVPEYMFNFASMNRARAAGLTLPYLLNVTPPPLNSQSSRVEMHPPPNAFVCEQVGLIVDKIVQYALAWVSGGGCDVDCLQWAPCSSCRCFKVNCLAKGTG